MKRWLATALSSGKYDSVLLEKTVLFPESQGTDQVTADTLKQITAYLDEALQRELKGVVKLASQPGPSTVRFKPAITAVAAQNQGLKPYQVVPVAFLFTMAKKAAGDSPKEASLAVEYEVRDAENNELVGAGVRRGTGQALAKPTDKVTLAAVKPVIDAWAKDARMFFQQQKPR